MGIVSRNTCSSVSRCILILLGPWLANCVGKSLSCPFLAASFFASIRLPTYVSLRNPIFVYQLTVVENVTMQLSNLTMQLSKVTMLDNYKAVYINIVNGNVCGPMSVHVFLHSNPRCISLVNVMLGATNCEH